MTLCPSRFALLHLHLHIHLPEFEVALRSATTWRISARQRRLPHVSCISPIMIRRNPVRLHHQVCTLPLLSGSVLSRPALPAIRTDRILLPCHTKSISKCQEFGSTLLHSTALLPCCVRVIVLHTDSCACELLFYLALSPAVCDICASTFTLRHLCLDICASTSAYYVIATPVSLTVLLHTYLISSPILVLSTRLIVLVSTLWTLEIREP